MIRVDDKQWLRRCGELTSVNGRLCATLDASMRELVSIETSEHERVLCEVIGFERDTVQLMPFSSNADFRSGNPVYGTGRQMTIGVGAGLLGRVLNAVGAPIDGGPPIQADDQVVLRFNAPEPLTRPSISQPLVTGIRAIDGLLTLGKGQRTGLFAGSGVGKSTLLGEITKYAEADVNVIVLVGERGREVRPFIEQNLGQRGLQKSIVFVSTSDQPPLARIRVCEAAVAVANWLRNSGQNVLFVLDSLSRMAYAQRELGLSLGEPPTSRGYTPSVFQKMAELLEQLGTTEKGSITGLVTILVDGDDMNEPVADAARSILDGHIVLNRDLANGGHFPAIDVLQSASRLFADVCEESHQRNAMLVRSILAKYKEVEDLIQIGAYQPGGSVETDRAVALHEHAVHYLRQEMDNPNDFSASQARLAQLAQQMGGAA